MATITPRKGKRGVRFTAQIRINRDGEQYTESKTFDSKRAAERWAAAREVELEKPGAVKKATRAGLTLGELIDRYMADFDVEHRYGRSKFAELKALKNMAVATLPIEAIQSSDLIEHIRWRRGEGAGPATAINDIVWIRVVMKTARPAYGIDVDLQQIEDAAELCRKSGLISRPERRDARPTLKELDLILEHFDNGRHKIPMVDLILFALFSSRRQAEITRLRWDDLKGHQILVRDMKDPRSKKGNDVWVYLTDEALAIINRQPKEGELIFPYNPGSVSANFTRACDLLGVNKQLNYHVLRHECTSWLFELQWPIPKVAQTTGHRSWQNLQRYTHLSEHGYFDKYAGWKWRP